MCLWGHKTSSFGLQYGLETELKAPSQPWSSYQLPLQDCMGEYTHTLSFVAYVVMGQLAPLFFA